MSKHPAAAAAAALVLLSCLLQQAASSLPPCNPEYVVTDKGQSTATVPEDCVWQKQEQLPAPSNVMVMSPRSDALFSALTVSGNLQAGPPVNGFTLTLKRLLLRNITLTPASGAGGVPRLLPLGLFSAVPHNVTLMDVRLVVDEAEFQQYLTLFRQQLRSSMDNAGAGPIMHTDNSSVLNVPYWTDGITEVFSLTLVSGPCILPNSLGSPWNQSLQQFPSIVGCNVRTADNNTLAATLLRDAANSTNQPLVVRLVTNVTLGPGLLQPIPIRRPVVLLGMASAVTSVDLAMMVNQLNVTLPRGRMYWQSLVLENLAPGDAVSSLVAPPYSTTVSTNVWAMYCNRSASSCLNLSNVTLVVPSQEELNYQVFMYTMFNSPAPALRDLTEFYRADLNTKVIQFVPGPGNDTLTVVRLVSLGWDFWYVVSTLRNVVAPQRPLPRQAAFTQKYRAGALVYALQDCGGFVNALSSRSTSTRTRVWTLINNVSIADKGQMLCPWPDGNITYVTQLLGPVVHTHGNGNRPHDSPGAVATPLSAEAIVLGQSGKGDGSNGTSNEEAAESDPYLPYDVGTSGVGGPTSPPFDELFALSFGYVPSLFQLPLDASDKFLQMQNITLRQLPQMAPSRNLRGRLMRRLLQRQNSDALPIGIWTILLWPFRRTMHGVPVTIADSQLLIPQPEWDVLAQEARQAPSFALQLQGQSGGLTFTGVSLLDNHTMSVGAFQGPGVAGTNLWLLPDPDAANSMPGYTWPSELFASQSSYFSPSSSNAAPGGPAQQKSVGLQAGIGVAVGVLGVLVVAAAAWLVKRRQKHRKLQQHGEGKGVTKGHASWGMEAGGTGACGPACMNGLSNGPKTNGCRVKEGQPQHLDHLLLDGTGEEQGSDTTGLHDTVGQLPNSQGVQPAAEGTAAAAEDAAAVAAGAAAAAGAAGAASSKASGHSPSSRTGAAQGSRSGPRPPSEEASGAAAAADGQQPVAGSSTSTGASSVQQTIAHGLERWNAAVSMTTLQLMQRRLQSNNALYSALTAGGSSLGATTAAAAAAAVANPSQQQQQQQQPSRGRASTAAPSVISAGSSSSAGTGADGVDQEHGLQLHGMIGTGSFGSVYLGSWRGKRVAVKVMHLQNNALMSGDGPPAGPANTPQQEQLERQKRQNSPPQMAIMEAVVSSTMSHPNVVQVYTYMLSPLMVQAAVENSHAPAVQPADLQQQQQQHRCGDKSSVFGWQLRLVMEYCDQGTLRDVLDKRRLPKLPGTAYPHPSVVFSLGHDIAAAMLHLHSEGIVHGDLKAGNVLLTGNSTPSSNQGCSSHLHRALEAWVAAGSQPLSAKVADFGMAMPLGPQDTHATMLARGTPTHMSPELFMAGHVSKASDVYAYGILLYEIITGCRAYAGVPIPLLPHEVAMQGLRPEWPKNIPLESEGLRQLAQACWAHKAHDRPSFEQIIKVLEGSCSSRPQHLDHHQQQQHHSPSPECNGQHPPPPQQQQAAAAGPSAAADGSSQQQRITPKAAVLGPPVVAERKPSRDQMDWSEISYGGSKHDGGWS